MPVRSGGEGRGAGEEGGMWAGPSLELQVPEEWEPHFK